MNLALTAALLAAAPASAQPQVTAAQGPPALKPLPVRVIGRAVREGGFWVRQWPATAFETAFTGRDAWFRTGTGDAILAISLDGREIARLVRPAPGLYRVRNIGQGPHVPRVQVVTESQSGPTRFGGFLAAPATRAAPLPAPRRSIRFVGDSHTVGYGNASAKRDCTRDEVWATTDATRAVPALLGRRYGVDVEVEAISGRGVVRNYDGFAADTLPDAYPFALLDRRIPWAGSGKAQLLVVDLGANDFSTPLKPGEKWKDREALRADFEASYVRFLKRLRAESPGAFLLVWIVDQGEDREATDAVAEVAARMAAAGEKRIAFVPVSGLAMTGCDWHPSAADDETIAAALARAIDAHPDIFARPR